MALTVGLEQAGLQPRGVKTSADVKLEKVGAGFAITSIALATTEVSVPGLEDAKFQAIAEETKKGCPVSKALAEDDHHAQRAPRLTRTNEREEKRRCPV